MKDAFLPLFVYGELRKKRPDDARVTGEVRMRGSDAAAKFGDQFKSTVSGQLWHASPEKEAAIKKMERPEYAPKRVRVFPGGQEAIAYEYVGKNWNSFPVVKSGDAKTKETE